MMDFTISNPVVAGGSAGNDFVISSAVDAVARTCDTTIELTRRRDGDAFSEQHRQYFHADADIRGSLEDAGFVVVAVAEEYTAGRRTPRRCVRPGPHGVCRSERHPALKGARRAWREGGPAAPSPTGCGTRRERFPSAIRVIRGRAVSPPPPEG